MKDQIQLFPEHLLNTPTPKNPTFDPVVPAQVPVEEVPVKSEPIVIIQKVEELKEVKKVIKKKSAPKKKTTK
jgi:hypothetical protein